MKRSFLLLSIALLVVGLSGASAAGQTAISVLDIEPGVRALGVGGAAVALADGPEALYYNSAGLAELAGIGFTSSYTSYLGLAGYTALGLAARNWGVGFLMLNSDNIPGYNADGTSTDALSYGSTAVLLGFGVDPKQFPFIPALPIDFRVGGRLKYLSVANGNTNGTGFGLDLGYRMGFPDMRLGPVAISDVGFGATATNIIGSLNYDGRSESLRMDLRFGFSARLARMVLVTADIELGGSFHFGAEYSPIQMLAVRVGILTEPGATSLTAGLGVNVEGFVIDYAFVSHPVLPASHRVSLTIDFSGLNLGGLASRLRSLLPF